MSRIRVRIKGGHKAKVNIKNAQPVQVKTDTTYLYDPTIIDKEVQQAKDWAIKTDGLVEEEGVGIDYSAKAYAIGGTGTTTNNAKYYAEQAGISETNASNSATSASGSASSASSSASLAKDWATKTDGTVDGSDYSAKYYAQQITPIATDITTVAGIASDVTTVAGIASNVTSVAGNATNINTVASDINRVNLVADDIDSVHTVAVDISTVIDVADNKTNIDAVSGNATNINAVAGNETNINAVAGNATNINAVNANKTNIDAVAGDLANIDAVANDLTNIDNASTYANNAHIWAEGSDVQVAGLGGEKSSKGWAIRAKQIVDSIGSVLRYKGSVATRNDLPSSGQEIGDMYNILADGSNVVWNGEDWDEISGIVDLTGYATEQWVTNQGYITGITSAMVTTALGYTPYNSTNPNGYQANVLEGVQVNGTDLTITNKKVNVSVPTQASDINAQPTLVSGTNIKTVNGNSLLGSGNLVISGLPSQTSQSGKFLTTNGTSASWANIPTEIPSQSGQNGKFLTTNGSSVSWATVNALPSQTGNSGKYLTTNGTSASWGEIAEYTAQEVETLWGSL